MNQLIVKMVCSYGDACFGCIVSLVGFQGGGYLGWLHNICRGSNYASKGLVCDNGEKKMFRFARMICFEDQLQG